MKIFGFSILRNGVKYDYSFEESLKSLAGVCESIVLALGESEDSSAEVVSSLDRVEILPTHWDMSLREGGLILSQQTNLALEHLRQKFRNDGQAWGIYLQADEVLHEEDYERIKQDIAHADELGCDVVRFRYFHFWQSHHRIAINKKWYPQEIRAVKLNSNVESWGDAQSFRHHTKVFESEACVYHYGHVREEESYKDKKNGFFKLYSSDQNYEKYVAKMEKKDAKTEVLKFWGAHPKIMKGRIERLGEKFQADGVSSIAIVGDKEKYTDKFTEKILADHVEWFSRVQDVPQNKSYKVVQTEPSFFHSFFNRELCVPEKMRSDLARPWQPETHLMLQLSAQDIGVK